MIVETWTGIVWRFLLGAAFEAWQDLTPEQRRWTVQILAWMFSPGDES